MQIFISVRCGCGGGDTNAGDFSNVCNPLPRCQALESQEQEVLLGGCPTERLVYHRIQGKKLPFRVLGLT